MSQHSSIEFLKFLRYEKYYMIDKFISPFAPKKINDVRHSAFKIYTFNAGYKKFKDDLLLIVFNKSVKMSAVFTKSSTPSAPVIWGKKKYKSPQTM